MSVWQSLDNSLFHFINASLSNPLFDRAMPFFSDTPFFPLILVAVLVALIVKGGARGRICAVTLALGLALGDGVMCDTIKHAVGRLRPFHAILDAHVLVGRGESFSMPSSHAANWFCATLITFIYYRRSIRFMLPLALLVSFSRIYNGVHYPSDVLAGMILGAGCGAFLIWAINSLWQITGPRWFPIWHQRMPSLASPAPLSTPHSSLSTSSHWLNLGYLLIAAIFLFRLLYLAAGKIELSEDEAYQWIWSKHPALSYFSKPPLIAYTQFLGTHLWGDNEFGIRFFSPVIAAILSFIMLRFLAKEAGGRVAFMLFIIANVTPLLALGTTVMTVDPLSVLFWNAAMVAGWRATQTDATTRNWLWVGLWMGLGFLSKYTNLMQLISWAVFFCLWPPARKQLAKPGPYLAILIVLLSTVPVLIWNNEHHWITVKHVASNGQLDMKWQPSLKYMKEFIMVEGGLLHPFFFVAMIWAAIAFWKTERKNPLLLYLFSMGAPVFIFYFLFTLHSRIQANWIVLAVIPLFSLMAVYWDQRWQNGCCKVKTFFNIAVAIGLFAVILTYDTNLIGKLLHHNLPPKFDLQHRVKGWKEIATMANDARKAVEAKEQKPAFILCEHYGFTAQISFYIPESRKHIVDDPFVYFQAASEPRNQFYFWPGYENRLGQNAIFVREIERPPLRDGWFKDWLKGGNDYYARENLITQPLPPEVRSHFDTITDLGVKNVIPSGKGIVRRIQLFECRNLH